MSNLLRKYKCYKLTNEIDTEIKEIFNFIENYFNNLKIFNYTKYGNNWIFYMNSKSECIFQYNTNVNFLYIRYENFLYNLILKININWKLKLFSESQMVM